MTIMEPMQDVHMDVHMAKPGLPVVEAAAADEVPDEFRAVVDEAMNDRLSAALHKAWGEQGPAPVQRVSVPLMTQESRAAIAQDDA